MYYVVSNDYLAHHGILGQKWGVRRYQNPDGSLTAAGRKKIASAWTKQYKDDPQGYTKMPKDVGGMDTIKRLEDDLSESVNKHKAISDEIMNVMSDYKQNREYWSSVSGVAVGLSFDDTKMRDLALRVNTNVYDDTDQGYMNSIGVWAKETGKDKVLNKLAKEESDAYKVMEDNVKSKVSDLLGKYGDKKIQGHATASSTMVNAIINSKDSYVSQYLDDASWGPKTDSEKASVKTAKSIVAKLSIGKGKNRAWNLMKAVENCGLDDVDFRDMSDSDWRKLSNELSRLSK